MLAAGTNFWSRFAATGSWHAAGITPLGKTSDHGMNGVPVTGLVITGRPATDGIPRALSQVVVPLGVVMERPSRAWATKGVPWLSSMPPAPALICAALGGSKPPAAVKSPANSPVGVDPGV